MIRAFASLSLALLLAACGGSSDSSGPTPDLAVSDTGPAEVMAGETVTFTATVSNAGPGVATNVTITHHLDGAPAVGAITCAATGGATCPAAVGESMTVDSLPVGGGLIFHIEVTGATDLTGAITSSLTAHTAADTNHDNDTAEATAIALDLRNGDYTVFASNGRQYTLTLNFNERTWEMAGSQVNQSGSLTPDPDGVSYNFNSTGTARFRTSQDLVVGGFDFNLTGSDHDYDHGVRPFVAARSFVTQAADLVGLSFNQMGLNLRRNDTIESPVLPTTFGTGVMQVCVAPIPTRVDQCPVQSLANYTLSVNAGTFSAVLRLNNTTVDSIQFRVALSGTNKILLRAQDAFDETGRHFRVGLPESAGLAGGTFNASSSRGAWGVTTLTDTHYSFSGTLADGTALDEAAGLAALVSTAPRGLRGGLRGSSSTKQTRSGSCCSSSTLPSCASAICLTM